MSQIVGGLLGAEDEISFKKIIRILKGVSKKGDRSLREESEDKIKFYAPEPRDRLFL